MAKSKKNYLVIVLAIALLSLAVGYAAFSQNLTISGTATGSTNWDVKFTKATMSDVNHGTVSYTDDVVTVSGKLSFPGDGFTVESEITNAGSLPAKLTSFTLTDNDGNEFTNDDITVEIPELATDGSEVIAAGEKCPVTISVKWNNDSEKETVSADFKVNFTYEQDTTAVTVSPDHGTHTAN